MTHDNRFRPGHLELTNAVGMKLHVAVNGVEDAYDLMRQMGAHGWTSGDVPAGGYVLPYAMADAFDFSLIGARQFEIKDGADVTQCVEHRGLVYTRREFEAKTGKIKMPAKIKYSRGAKPTDEPHLKEGAEGEKSGYITLITFVGGARSIPEFERPRAQATRASAPGDTSDQDLGHRGQLQQNGTVNLDALLAKIEPSKVRSLKALAQAKKLQLRHLITLIGSVAGLNMPLEPAQYPELIDKIKQQQVAA